MKQILFLAPYSIPLNNPEAICNGKLLKLLASHGYKIDLIYKNNKRSYTPSESEDIFASQIHYKKCFYLNNTITLQTIFDHIRTLLKTHYVYKGAHWAFYAIKESEKLLEQNHYDWILSRSPASELAAFYLSKKYNIPWIANWNDPYPETRMPSPYGGGPNAPVSFLQNRLLKKITEQATIHTFPSKRLSIYMQQYMNINPSQIRIIPHLCSANLISPVLNRNPNKLKIVHSGNVSAPRDPGPFLEALHLLRQVENIDHFEVNFIGKQETSFQEQVKAYGLGDIVHIIPPMSYLNNLEFIQTHDIALLIEAPSSNSVYLPTKVSDYMQCAIDIFSVSANKGTLHDLYQEKKIMFFADCQNPEQIKTELQNINSKLQQLKKKRYSDYPIPLEYTEDIILKQYQEMFESC